MSISFAPGSTSKSIDIRVYDDDGLPVTGLVAATMPTVKYSLAGANADATITLSDLATIGTAWSSGGLKERGEGVYRLDLPNEALTTAGIVTVRGEATGKRIVCEAIEVSSFAALSTNASGQVTVGDYAVGKAPLTAAETRSALGMAAADLDTQLDAILANTGTGARTVTLTVNDGTTALEGARVRMIKGGENYVGATNASGQIVFSLDDGTWSVAISLAGYTFTPTTLAVSATTSHTYSMTAVTLTPSSPGLTTGYLTCYSKLGVAQSGVSVIVSVAEEGDADGSAYPDTVRTATSDTNGLVEFTNMHKGLTYRIQRGSTAAKAYTFTIPTSAGSTYELPTIIGD